MHLLFNTTRSTSGPPSTGAAIACWSMDGGMDGIKAARAIGRAALRELGVGNGAEAIHAAAEFRESACGSPGVVDRVDIVE